MQNLQPVEQQLRVITCPHPFRVERQIITMAHGMTIGELLIQIQPDIQLQRQVFISIDGEPIPRDMWDTTIPRAGSLVVVRVIPASRGIAMIFVTIAAVIATVVTTIVTYGGAAPGWAAFWGAYAGAAAGVAGALAAMAVGIVGNLLINALIPPAAAAKASLSSASTSLASTTSQDQDTATQFVTGAKNQLIKYGTIPRLLGFSQIVPLKIAEDFSESVGKDQFVRCLFGQYGPLHTNDYKVGETSIDLLSGVTMEIRQGYASDSPITLYTKDVHEEALSILLEPTTGIYTSWVDAVWVDPVWHDGEENPWAYTPGYYTDGYWIPGYWQGDGYEFYWSTRTTQVDADSFSIDITFPNGLYKLDSENVRGYKIVLFLLMYRKKGTTDWTVGPNCEACASTNSAVRISREVRVPRGQYEVRIARAGTADETDEVSTCYWTALRTWKNGVPVTYPDPLYQAAVRIQASSQLNGTLDEFNFYAQSIFPDYIPATGLWTERPTNNPASLFRTILQDVASPNPIPDSRIDLAKLEYWHEYCTAKGFAYNKNVDESTNWWGLLQEIAAAGRAAPCQYDGKWSVVLDEAQDAAVTIFNPRTMKDLEVDITYPDLPHAFRCPFKDETNSYIEDEYLVLDDGYQIGGKDAWGQSAPGLIPATKFEQLTLPGITHPDLVFKLARYHIAAARLRFRKISFTTNVQQIVCTKGDKILISHDVMLVGLSAGRVKTLNYEIIGYDDDSTHSDDSTYGDPIYGDNLIGVTMDEVMPMEAGKSYGLQFRVPGEEPVNRQIVTDTGYQTTVLFTDPIPPDTTDLAVGDLATFGEFGQETIPVIVKSIEQKSGLWAKLICLDEAPAIHLADQGIIPKYESHITFPAAWNPPVAENIRSDITVMIKTVNGWQCRILITLANWQTLMHPKAVGVEAQFWVIGADNPKTVLPMQDIANGEISLMPVNSGQTYDFQLRYVDRDGTRYKWSDAYRHKVIGLTILPDITNLVSFYRDGRVVLKWDQIVDPITGYTGLDYEVRKGAAWAIAEVLGRVKVAEFITQGDGDYWVAAHITGLYSPTPVSVDVTGSNLAVNVLVSEDEYSDGWPGIKTSTHVNPLGFLELSGVGLFDDIGDEDSGSSGGSSGGSNEYFTLDDVADIDLYGGMAVEGYYEIEAAKIVDLGDVQPCTLNASYISLSHDFFSNVDDYPNFDEIPDMDGEIAGLTTVKVQVAIAGADEVFGTWQDFYPGQYYARKFKFRLVLTTNNPKVSPMVEGFNWTVDMPDRIESGTVDLDAGGNDVTYSRPFQVIPDPQITIYNAATGDEIFLTSKTASGFHAQVKNAGSGVAKTIHHMEKAY